MLAAAAPILFAVIGETISERAGVLNLSMNGMILLSAMGSFAVALATVQRGARLSRRGGHRRPSSPLIVAFASLTLPPVAGGGRFLCSPCSAVISPIFLGNPIMGKVDRGTLRSPIPGFERIPVLGTIFFRQDVMTYLSFILIVLAWFFIFRTRPGLILRGSESAPPPRIFRGANVNRLRYLYAVIGGAIAGLAGPIYSLSVKAGWKGTISGLDGIGWIVLSITIFGGWKPFRAAFGAYLFAFLQWLGLVLQPSLPSVPSQVLQVAPFPLMILSLLLVNIGNAEWVDRSLSRLPENVRRDIAKVLRAMNATPPAALGVPFEKE